MKIPSVNGDILITSIKRLDRGTEIQLDIFTAPEAIEFLHKRTNIDDRISAGEIANRLGYLPLALEQTAAFTLQIMGFVKHPCELPNQTQQKILFLA